MPVKILYDRSVGPSALFIDETSYPNASLKSIIIKHDDPPVHEFWPHPCQDISGGLVYVDIDVTESKHHVVDQFASFIGKDPDQQPCVLKVQFGDDFFRHALGGIGVLPPL